MSRPLSRYAQALAVFSHCALLIALLHSSQTGIGIIAALLLLAPLPGLLRGREYTYSWACMLIAFYCAMWLAEGYADPQSKLRAFVIAGIAALDFVSLVLFVRLRGRERLAQKAASAAASH
jgi:uncharacterized membrane protein